MHFYFFYFRFRFISDVPPLKSRTKQNIHTTPSSMTYSYFLYVKAMSFTIFSRFKRSTFPTKNTNTTPKQGVFKSYFDGIVFLTLLSECWEY